MATKRKDGWVVVQMLLREDEYQQVFTPLREAAGFGGQTESAFLRARCGLTVPAPRATSAEVPAGTSSRKERARKRRTKTKKRSQKRGARTKQIGQHKGSWESASGAKKANQSVPFVGHIEYNEEDADGLIERPVETEHPPPPPADEASRGEVGVNAKSSLDFSEELSLLADILPVDPHHREPN